MEVSIGSRIKHAWNAFLNRDPTGFYRDIGVGYSYRPDRPRLTRGNERSIVTSVYNRIALDCASINIQHVRLDDSERFLEKISSGLNDCLNLSANIDQTDVYKRQLGQKLPKSQKTLNMYVNDAIGFKMVPEQPLFYSENCFGTTDAIAFRNRMLRIHDLKTGVIPAHMEQLEIYAALFCLEYKIKPADIEMELRIYQNNQILYENPTAETIVPIMDKIITFDKVINKIKEQEG